MAQVYACRTGHRAAAVETAGHLLAPTDHGARNKEIAHVSMTTIAIIGGAVIAAFALYRLLQPGIDGRVGRAVRDRSVDALLVFLNALPEASRPTAYNRAVRLLWDAYERELAMPVIRELALRHADSRIAQYWLDQAQRVEPELATGHLGRAFLAEHFNAGVAAKCGSAG